MPTYARFVQPERLEYFDVGPYRIAIIVVKMQRKDYWKSQAVYVRYNSANISEMFETDVVLIDNDT